MWCQYQSWDQCYILTVSSSVSMCIIMKKISVITIKIKLSSSGPGPGPFSSILLKNQRPGFVMDDIQDDFQDNIQEDIQDDIQDYIKDGIQDCTQDDIQNDILDRGCQRGFQGSLQDDVDTEVKGLVHICFNILIFSILSHKWMRSVPFFSFQL